MSMKKKIRKAFDSATPDVLSRVLKECPDVEENAAVKKYETAAPMKINSKFREVLATAAAFALLLSVIGGTVLYGKILSERPDGGQTTDPSTQNTETEPTDNTDHTVGPTYPPEDKFDELTEKAKALVCPDETDRESVNTNAAYLTDNDEDALYHLELEYEGYCYSFLFDADTAEMVDIGVIDCDCVKEGYISGDMAIAILLHSMDLEEENVSPTAVLFEEEELAYYSITLMDHPELAGTVYYVNARTGEVFEFTTTDEIYIYESQFHGEVEDLDAQGCRTTLVRSVEELKALHNSEYIPYWEDDYDDEAFFEKYSLIIHDYVVPMASTQVVLDSLTENERGYQLDVCYYYWPEAADQITRSGSIVIEIPKVDADTEVYCHRIPQYPTAEEYDALFGENAAWIESFNIIFSDYKSWYNRALTCHYSSPAELRLKDLFYNGISGEAKSPTDQERELLKDQFAELDAFDLMRLPTDKMNEVLKTYFGVTLDDLSDECFEGLVYLEETDCYYLCHNDANGVWNLYVYQVNCLADDTFEVLYTTEYDDILATVTVSKVGDGYQILSNIVLTLEPTVNIPAEE